MRQVRSSPSTASGELPTRTETATPSLSTRSNSIVVPSPSGPRISSNPIGRPPAMNFVNRDPTIDSRGHDSSSASRRLAYRITPARRHRRRAVAHVLDEHPVRPVSGRQREHATVGSSVGDDEGVDLAGGDRAKRVLGLGHPDQRVGSRRPIVGPSVGGVDDLDDRVRPLGLIATRAPRRVTGRSVGGCAGHESSTRDRSASVGRAEGPAPGAPCRCRTGRRRPCARAAAGSGRASEWRAGGW